MMTIGVARIFDWGRGVPNHKKKPSQSDLELLIGGGAKCSWSSISDWGAQPTTWIVNDLNKQRSSRIKGPILSQKLGEDQKNGHHGTNLSILALLRFGGACPPLLATPMMMTNQY